MLHFIKIWSLKLCSCLRLNCDPHFITSSGSHFWWLLHLRCLPFDWGGGSEKTDIITERSQWSVVAAWIHLRQKHLCTHQQNSLSKHTLVGTEIDQIDLYVFLLKCEVNLTVKFTLNLLYTYRRKHLRCYYVVILTKLMARLIH